MIDWTDSRVVALCERASHYEESAAVESIVCEAIELGAQMERERAYSHVVKPQLRAWVGSDQGTAGG